jgi:hypothetical protein
MKLTQSWWHNAEKNKLVPEGHPDAAFLAYPAGHEVNDDVARHLGMLVDPEPEGDDKAEAEAKAAEEAKAKAEADEAEVKSAAKPADKSAAKRPGDK